MADPECNQDYDENSDDSYLYDVADKSKYDSQDDGEVSPELVKLLKSILSKKQDKLEKQQQTLQELEKLQNLDPKSQRVQPSQKTFYD